MSRHSNQLFIVPENPDIVNILGDMTSTDVSRDLGTGDASFSPPTLTLDLANIVVTVSEAGVVSLESDIGEPTTSTPNFDRVASPTQRNVDVSLIVPEGYENTGATLNDTFTSIQPATMFNPATVGTWSPSLGTRTANFEQSGTDSNGISGTRDVTVTQGTNAQDSTEAIQGIDVNGDGDRLDNIRRTRTSYTGSVTSPSSANIGVHYGQYGSWFVTSNANPVDGTADWDTGNTAELGAITGGTLDRYELGSFGEWEPAFVDQTTGFEQTRTASSVTAVYTGATRDGRQTCVVQTNPAGGGSAGRCSSPNTAIGGTRDVDDFFTGLTRTETGITPTENNGGIETRDVTIEVTETTEPSTEAMINEDVNNDGDMIDDIERTVTTYTANHGLGSHVITSDWVVTTNRSNITLTARISPNVTTVNRGADQDFDVTVGGTATGTIGYQWTANGGSIAASGSSATFTADNVFNSLAFVRCVVTRGGLEQTATENFIVS